MEYLAQLGLAEAVFGWENLSQKSPKNCRQNGNLSCEIFVNTL
jgi:hypothetical protein